MKRKSAMMRAVEYVHTHPGCSKQEAALAVGPSVNAGYIAIANAYNANLIEQWGERGSKFLYTTPDAIDALPPEMW